MASNILLEDLLEGVAFTRLIQPCKDVHLARIALSITQWHSIAPFLKLTSTDERAIEERYRSDLISQNIAMLRKWRESRGRRATYMRLAKIFYDLGKISLVEVVSEVLKGECSSSESEGESEQGCVGGPGSQRWTVPRYADYLKGRYRTTRPHVLSHQFLPPPTRTVFNLALIQKQRLEFGPNEELVRLLQRGQVKEAAESHTEIELSNLMRTDDEVRKIILIEGAPGSGKSTLSWHICQQWGEGELLTEYEVVVFVQLRDLELQSARSLGDILPLESTDMAPDTAALLTRSGRWGRGVLLVMDGWDELQPDCPLHSLLMQLIANPTCLNMHFSSLIITSRPVTSGELQCYASSRVEVLGFKPEEVQEYFNACFGRDHQLYTRFVAQLRERSVIEAACYLPLNAVIVYLTFLACGYSLPRTLHGVFEKLVLSCIVRHVTDRGEAKVGITASCLSDLPPDIGIPLLALSSLAFHGIWVNKVVFSERDLKVFNLPTDLSSTLSLVQVVESFGVCGHSKSYNFYHLQIQELLAAYHISKLEEYEQVRIFKDLFGQPRFAAVFQFYAAFTKLQAKHIREILVDMVKVREYHSTVIQCVYEAQDPSLCQFIGFTLQTTKLMTGMPLFFLSSSCSPLYVIALGYFLCYYICYCTDELQILVFNDFNVKLFLKEFLHHQPLQLQPNMYGSLAFTLTHSVNHDWEAFVRCVSELLSSLKPFITGLTFDIQDFKMYEKFSSVVSTLVESTVSLKYLTLFIYGRGSFVEPVFLRLMNSIHCSKQLHSFTAIGAVLRVPVLTLKAVSSTMATNSAIKYLQLTNCQLNLTYPANVLLHAIEISNNLKVIDLTRTSLGECVYPLLMGLTSNTSVVELILKDCEVDLTGENGQALCNMLRTNTTLRALNLGSNGAVDLQAVCAGLTLNISLAYLDLSWCKLIVTAESGRALAHMLQTNTTLKSLKLDYNRGISNEGAVYLAQGLAQNRGLETLSVVRCGIFTAIVELAEALNTNSCLLSLDMSDNKDVGERFVHIVRSLQVNSTLRDLRARECGIAHTDILDIATLSLESLDLSLNPIGDEGAEHIAQWVTNSRSLYQLSLGACGIGDRGVECLASALEGNTSLEILHILKNRFTDSGLLALGRSLKRNKALKTLNVARCATPVGLKQLVLCLCENEHLTHLGLSDLPGLSYDKVVSELSDEVNQVNQIRREKNHNSLSTFEHHYTL